MTGDCLCLTLGIDCTCVRRGPGGFGYRPHGTMAAVRRHYRRKTPLCEPCRRAQRDRPGVTRAFRAARRLAAEQAARRAVLAEAAASVDGRTTRYRGCGQPVDGPVGNEGRADAA